MDWFTKNSSAIIEWGAIGAVIVRMYWQLKQDKYDIIELKKEIKELRDESARKNEVDKKIDGVESRLHEDIQRLESDIKNQNDLTRNFVDKIFNEFTEIRKEMNAGFTSLQNTILTLLKQ